jgi:putative DNA primase/helicase
MIDFHDLTAGNHRLSCPACGRKPSDKTLGVTVDHDGCAVAHCFRCNYVETYRPEEGAAYRPSRAPIRPVRAAKRDTLSDYGRELWEACRPVHGPARAYLMARHCALPPEDGDLRCHPALKHPSGYVGPALVALVTDAATREPISLHRTWIQPDGRKADVDPPRMLLGGHRKQGGVIRLWPDECATYGLGIAEGIETALTLATALQPVWSLIDAGNLAAFPVLAGIEVLTIAADHDEAGLAAANSCATRWAEAGCDVRMVIPPRERTDLNDYAREAA